MQVPKPFGCARIGPALFFSPRLGIQASYCPVDVLRRGTIRARRSVQRCSCSCSQPRHVGRNPTHGTHDHCCFWGRVANSKVPWRPARRSFCLATVGKFRLDLFERFTTSLRGTGGHAPSPAKCNTTVPALPYRHWARVRKHWTRLDVLPKEMESSPARWPDGV